MYMVKINFLNMNLEVVVVRYILMIFNISFLIGFNTFLLYLHTNMK